MLDVEKISIEKIGELADSAPPIILWAVPVIFFFVLVEAYFSYRQNRNYYNVPETIGSVGLGVGNILISFWIKVVLFYLAVLVYNELPWRMSLSWWTLIPCYIIFDFCSYWAHSVSHRQRVWWATHVAHHSGEYYNLTVAFRLSWIQHLKIVFLIPVFLLGFHPIIFFVTNQLATLFQFWVHTEYIGKLPRLIEYIFATPSNHRVHHGSQPEYINKNFGATFIFWDRIFGTYQKEMGQVKYGISESVPDKANILYLNFHELVEIIRDVKGAKGWRRKAYFIFGDPMRIAEEKKALQKIEMDSATSRPGDSKNVNNVKDRKRIVNTRSWNNTSFVSEKRIV
jgi:sterol desaturase/sphingolipid hydroxylase (fatty acid hydroxylase superfamily)